MPYNPFFKGDIVSFQYNPYKDDDLSSDEEMP